MSVLPSRAAVLRLYARVFRVARVWQAQDPVETKVERQYMEQEAKVVVKRRIHTFYQKNSESWKSLVH